MSTFRPKMNTPMHRNPRSVEECGCAGECPNHIGAPTPIPPPQDLPPFSGDDPTCPKCGHIGAGTTYVATPCMDLGDGHTVLLGGPDEHLCRRCSRCGYTWDESTVTT